MKRVLVFGGRDFGKEIEERRAINKILAALKERIGPFVVVQGGAPGVDTSAAQWANAHELPTVTHRARWRELGKTAGPIRNQEMLDMWKPDCAVAFPGGRGTDDMYKRTQDAGVKMYDFRHRLLKAEAGLFS